MSMVDWYEYGRLPLAGMSMVVGTVAVANTSGCVLCFEC